MTNEIGQKPPPSILVARFKALLKQREDELGLRASGEASPPTTEEIVRIYEELLSELTSNVKPIITDLTIVAEQQRDHAKGIADAICARILEVPADQKLPSLYLLDSIVKNFGQEYIRYFSLHLPEVFCVAYRQVRPNSHSAMRHLFGTWSKVFHPSVLRKIEAQLQFSQAINNQQSSVNPLRTSESARPSNGIHVNPKYLRQMEHSSSIMDSVGGERLDLTGTVGNTNFGPVASKNHQFVPSRSGRSSSPSRTGLNRASSACMDEYAADNSVGRTVESESPHPAVDYGVAKALGREEELIEWHQKQFSGDGRNRFQTSMTYSLSNGQQRQSPRALIDAYGSDKSQETSSSKPLLVELLDRNGIDKVSTTSWQNTEEEEFDWEDMSPTLVDHNRNNGFLKPTIGFSAERPVIVAANATSSDQDTRKGWSSGSQFPPVDDSSVTAEDAFASSAYGRVSRGQVSGFQNQINESPGSGQHLDAWKISNHLSNSSQHLFNIRGRDRNLLMPPIHKIPNTDVNPYGTRLAVSRIVPGLKSNMEGHLPVLPPSFEMRPSVNVYTARPSNLNPIFPLQNHARTQFESINGNNSIVSHGPNKSLPMREQLLDSVDNKDISKGNRHPLPNHLAGPITSSHRNRGQVPQVQFLPSQDPAASQFSRGSSLQGQSASMSTLPLPVMQFPPSQSIANNSLRLQGGALPPLPNSHLPAPSQMVPHHNASPSVSSQQPTLAYSNLINSLMAQGIISLTNQPPGQDSVGIEFNPDILKVRHESAVSALYGDLPRQCTTCGLRFKCQDEHSSHMDWHVTKNRMSKNRKQKLSRKWFVSERMWLSGAEALGTESIPGFLPTETIEVKKEDEELAVPAEEDQNTCALCGEPFDEFYSDETEEWMYRGAVYLNAPEGTTAGMDRSQLGPIIHAKCRSESSIIPAEDFGLNEGGTYGEGSQRKRMRVD
ncbi:polyadenylation and cleavage factor homolog 4-like [Gastrolobium bilobum]|uniref:polyadenylation and cleavage factor homolog 4-like n=1 Tax=Gastrolobium bilobum TaxID=150636 RepID=UPI002AB2469D|nr:polyadenylation and cleavage factor homolog 4-like [Gastrolobium bilobum]